MWLILSFAASDNHPSQLAHSWSCSEGERGILIETEDTVDLCRDLRDSCPFQPAVSTLDQVSEFRQESVETIRYLDGLREELAHFD